MCVFVWHYLASVNKQKFCILNGLSELEEAAKEAEAEKSLPDCGERPKRSRWVWLWVPLFHYHFCMTMQKQAE